MLTSLLALALLGLTFGFPSQPQSSTLIREPLDGYPLARCNDHSQAVYYHTDVNDAPQSNVIIFMQGGGLCWDLDMCLLRCDCDFSGPTPVCQGGLCRAPTALTRTMNGIMSDDPGINAPFHDYYKVFMPYCSSDLYIGNRTDDVDSGGLMFMGKQIVRATIMDLINRVDLSNAANVIITGSSAGGSGTFMNCDMIAEMLPNSRVRCIPDAPGFFPVFDPGCALMPDPNDSGELWNAIFDESCEAAEDEIVKDVICQNYATGAKYVDTESFTGMGRFDTWMMTAGCIDLDDPAQVFEWAEETMNTVDELVTTKNNHGVFMPSCRIHGMNGNLFHFNDIQVGPDGLTYAELLKNWMDGAGPTRGFDDCDLPDCNGNC